MSKAAGLFSIAVGLSLMSIAQTPAGGRAWDGNNPFFQPAATTDYWGSGDVDGDGVITAADAALAQRMASGLIPSLTTADVNGDGIVDAVDVALINGAIGGATLPGWWNKLTTPAQRNAWVDKVLARDPTNDHPAVYWFQCLNFAVQTHIHGAFYRNDLFGTDYSGGQTWFNIPLYAIDLGSIGHAVNAILTGDDPLNPGHWRFIEPQDDSDVSHAAYLNGHTVSIMVPDKIQPGAFSAMGGEAKVVFSVDSSGVWSLQSHSPNLVLTRPAPPAMAPDNRPDLWNPTIVAAGAGILLFDRKRADMTRVDGVHVTDLPFVDPPAAKALVFDSEYSRLLDVTTGPDGAVHVLWAGSAGYVPGVIFTTF